VIKQVIYPRESNGAGPSAPSPGISSSVAMVSLCSDSEEETGSEDESGGGGGGSEHGYGHTHDIAATPSASRGPKAFNSFSKSTPLSVSASASAARSGGQLTGEKVPWWKKKWPQEMLRESETKWTVTK
jgi:hypothetical protein